MNLDRLREARLLRGDSQQQAADRMCVTQAYFSMLEKGTRAPSGELARKLVRRYGLSPTALPVSKVPRHVSPDFWAAELAALGYPGFAHLRHGAQKVNPATFLLAALAQPNLEARVAEGLPWLVWRYPDMNFDWLVPEVRMKNLQNRLGFAVTLARLAGHRENLLPWESMLADSKLEKQDSFCKELTEPERRWLREHSSREASQWNLLSDLRAETLRYVA